MSSPFIYYFLRFLHILLMALWFGSVLFTGGDIKRTIQGGGNLDLLRDRVNRAQRASAVGAWGSIITGFLLIAWLGGMKGVPWPIHIGWTIAFVMIGIGAAGLGGTWAKIDAAATAGKTDETAALLKRYGMLGGIFHSLWLGVLLLMVFRFVL